MVGGGKGRGRADRIKNGVNKKNDRYNKRKRPDRESLTEEVYKKERHEERERVRENKKRKNNEIKVPRSFKLFCGQRCMCD